MFHAYLFIGLMESFFSFCSFFWYLQWYANLSPLDVLFSFSNWADGYKNYSIDQLNEFIFKGQTIFFISLVIMQSFGNVFATRTNYYSLLQRLPFRKNSRNIWIFIAQLISVVLMILIIFLPFCNNLFNTRPVPIEFFFMPLIFAFIILLADELRKLMLRNNLLCFPDIAW